MIVKLLTEHRLEFLSLKGGFTGSSESTHGKMPHCWKSHATAHSTISIRTRIQLNPIKTNSTVYHVCFVNWIKMCPLLPS